MIADLAKLKLGADYDRPCEALQLDRLLTFPARLSNLLAVDSRGLLIYPSGSFLLLDGQSQVVLRGHDAEITALAHCPRAELAATGQSASPNAKDYESPVVLWDLRTRSVRKVLVGLRQGVKSLAFSSNGQYLAGLSERNFLIIWSVSTMTILHKRVYEFTVDLIAYLDVILFTVGGRLHSLTLKLPGQPVEAELVLPSSGLKRVYTGAVELPDRSIIMSTKSGQLAHFDKMVFKNVFVVGKGEVSSLLFYEGSIYAAVGQELARLEFKADKMVQKSRTFLGLFIKALVPAASKKMYAQTPGQLLQINSQTLEAKIVIEAHKGQVRGLSFRKGILATVDSVQGKAIDPASLRVYSRCVSPALKPSGTSCVCAGQKCMVVGWADGAIRGYALSGKKQQQPNWEIVSAHKGRVSSVFVDENYILSGGEDSVVRIWARSNRQQLNQLSVHQKTVTRVLPDLRDPALIHSCSLDKSIHTYNLKTDRKEAYHQAKNGSLTDLAQHPATLAVFTAGHNSGLSGWTIKQFYPVAHVELPIKLSCLSFSPDGGLLAVGNQFGQIWIYESGGSKLGFLGRLQGHSQEVSGLAWVSDRVLVSGSLDGSLAVWVRR